jgi:hypothetical protein
MGRVFHRVEMIEIAEELVEAVNGRQELIEITEMVLAELSCGVAHGLQHRGNSGRSSGQADGRASLANRGHAGAYRKFTRDEVRSASRATCLGIVVGEEHAFGRELVEIGCPASHHAAIVGSDIPDADVIGHNDDDVGFLAGSLSHRDLASRCVYNCANRRRGE